MKQGAMAALVAATALCIGGCSSDGRRSYHDADPILLAIGSPDPAAAPMRNVRSAGSGIYRYRHHVGQDAAFAWLADLPRKMGCERSSIDVTPRQTADGNWNAQASCYVNFEDSVWFMLAEVHVYPSDESTSVQVRER